MASFPSQNYFFSSLSLQVISLVMPSRVGPFTDSFSLGLLIDPEDGGDAFLHLVCDLLPDYTAS
jgi:hypothetical protein